jgi:glycerophosphoryl diester phosphodiesterase
MKISSAGSSLPWHLNDPAISGTDFLISLFLDYLPSLLIFSAVLFFSSELRSSGQAAGLPEPRNGIYVIAHRGVHNSIPENSLPAYRKAIELGCDFVEIDVRTTIDGKFISIHNSQIDDYVKVSKGKVKDMTLEQLRSLDIGIKTSREWKGTRIPTLEEILELCRGKIGIYLDLKKAPVPELVGIIKSYGMEKQIIWYISSSDLKDITDLRSSCPECILMPNPGSGENLQPLIDMFKPVVVATDMKELNAEFVAVAHRNNVKVITDEKKGNPAEWDQILTWQTDGIQTDHPEELIKFLKSMGK